MLLHFSLHTQLVPDPDRCLLCSPCNNSTVDHLQIKEECLPKTLSAGTVSDADGELRESDVDNAMEAAGMSGELGPMPL